MPRTVSLPLTCKLALLHVVVIALANYTVQFTGNVFGHHFTYAMFVFPVVVLATDLTVRLSGQRTARIIVALAYIPAILLSAWLADWRIGIASGTAYLTGQLLDISIFQRVRDRYPAWWTAPLVSTLLANVIDTYIFYSAAFYRSRDAFMSEHWVGLANVDLVFKIIIGIVLFLPAYGVLLAFMQSRMQRHQSRITPEDH